MNEHFTHLFILLPHKIEPQSLTANKLMKIHYLKPRRFTRFQFLWLQIRSCFHVNFSV